MDWPARVRPGEVLGRGAEGTVYALRPDTVITLWTPRTAPEGRVLATWSNGLKQRGCEDPRPRAVDIGAGAKPTHAAVHH